MVIAAIAVFILDINEAGPPRDFYLVRSHLRRAQIIRRIAAAIPINITRMSHQGNPPSPLSAPDSAGSATGVGAGVGAVTCDTGDGGSGATVGADSGIGAAWGTGIGLTTGSNIGVGTTAPVDSGVNPGPWSVVVGAPAVGVGPPAPVGATVGVGPVTGARVGSGVGAKGPRLYDWATVEIRPLREPGKGYWLLARRSIAKPEELAYYVCYGPAGAALEELVQVAGRRWAIEECFEEAKGQVGLDQYEVRRWDGWHRHITLAMVAYAYLAVIRHHASPRGRSGEKGVDSAVMQD